MKKFKNMNRPAYAPEIVKSLRILRRVRSAKDLFNTSFILFNNRGGTPSQSPLLNALRWIVKITSPRRLTMSVVALTFALVSISYAQDSPTKNEAIDLVTTGLQVGDTIPALELSSLHNYSSERLQLPVSGVDLTIVDFWATWCGACIAHFPTMVSIKETLNDRVQFISVSKESEEEVQIFLKKWENSDKPDINYPFVSGDTVLNAIFPHRTLPHYVWIDRDGVVVAISDSKAVTLERIESVLSGNTESIRTKRDMYRAYDKAQPLLYNGSLDDMQPQFYSELTGYQEGLVGGFSFSQYFPNIHPDFVRITVRNAHILQLLQLAHRDLVSNPMKFFQVNVSEEDKLVPRTGIAGEEFLNWLRDGNGFCYEIILPASQKENLLPFMRNVLLTYFSQYTATVEDIPAEFWVLKSNNIEKVRSKGGEKVIDNTAQYFRLQNASLYPLVDRLGFFNRDQPTIVDETGIDFNVDLDIQANMRDIEDVNRALKPYGLYFELITRPTPTLVISDNPNKP